MVNGLQKPNASKLNQIFLFAAPSPEPAHHREYKAHVFFYQLFSGFFIPFVYLFN